MGGGAVHYESLCTTGTTISSLEPKGLLEKGLTRIYKGHAATGLSPALTLRKAAKTV